jgi:hypothetical protein
MAGPYPPHHPVGAQAPNYRAAPPPYAEPYPDQFGQPPTGAYPGVYPGMLPPPVPYPRRRRWRLLGLSLLAVLVVVGVVAAVIAIRADKPTSAGPLTDAAAKTAIQGYLDALSKGDNETIQRNTLCGMYDAVRDRRGDLALAKLSSDAFRRQFSRADVTSIDKIVYWSSYQAQVLFTMRVAPASRGAARDEEQGVAQILRQDNQILVCSYLLRTAGQF